jgi:hypothetical protein
VSKLFATRRRIAVVGITAVMVLASGGAAYAYFTATGSGTGAASVGSASSWEVTATSDTTGDLLPGSGSEILTFTITNEGSGDQAFNSVSATIISDNNGNVKAGGSPVSGCMASWFAAELGTPVGYGYGESIPSGDSATVPVTVTMSDSGTNQDKCQGIDGPDVKLTVNSGNGS